MKKTLFLAAIMVVLPALFGSCDIQDDPVMQERTSQKQEVANTQERHKGQQDEGQQNEENQAESFSLPETRLTLSEAEMQNIAPTNEFTIKFFRDNYASGSDMLLSPLGIQQTMAMVGNLVKDEEHFYEMLGFEGAKATEVNDYYKHLIENLSGQKFSKELKLANAMISDIRAKKYPDSFLDVMKNSYFADYMEIEAKSLHAQPVGSRPEDVWCREKTGGLINSAPKPIMEATTSLLNAICFNGEWQDKFDKDRTIQDRFYVKLSESVPMSFMRKTSTVPYYENQEFCSASLPFGDGTFTLSIILPKTTYDVTGLLEKFDSNMWETMRKGLVKEELNLGIPVFSTSYSYNMILDCKYKDGVEPFDALAQKATFLMNEDGASAAAVTQVFQATAAGPSENRTKDFYVNHPFVYTISEAGSGLILFIGAFCGGEGSLI